MYRFPSLIFKRVYLPFSKFSNRMITSELNNGRSKTDVVLMSTPPLGKFRFFSVRKLYRNLKVTGLGKVALPKTSREPAQYLLKRKVILINVYSLYIILKVTVCFLDQYSMIKCAFCSLYPILIIK